MLTSIRTAASNWLGRLVLTVIMGLLIVSFAIWGIGDIFRGGTTRNVVNVGRATISAEQYRTSFNDELRRLQQQSRRAITNDEARAFGLDRVVLNRLIDETVLNSKTKDFGLALEQPLIISTILNESMFKVNGQFDRGRFNDILQQNNLSEAQYIRQHGELMLRQQIANGLVGGFRWTETLGKAVHQYRDEERNLDVVVIPAERAVESAAPDEAALKAFHEERKSEFRTVETRKATVLATSSTQFARDVTVTEADIRAFYDKALAAGRFGTPEKRRALRILFDNEADAKAAADKLKNGASIESVLADKKLTEKDVDLGLKARAELADAAVRDAVFSLQPGATSAPIKDAFGFVLIRLVAIEPAKATPFEAVRAQIEGEARLDRIANDPKVKAQLEEFYKKIEEQRVAGKSLAEAATATGLTAVSINALDKQGGDGAGNRLSIAGGMDVVNAIFASDIGLDNEPLQQRDGGHVWFEVNGVDPARDKGFDEVKDEVKARFIANAKSKALAEQVTALVKRVEGGETLAKIAGELGIQVQQIAGLKRSAKDVTLGQAGVERAFAGNLGKVVSAIAPDGIGRILIVPTSASLLPYDAEADVKSGFSKQIAQGLSEDIMVQYVAALRKEAGVSINQSVLAQALGQTN